MSGKLYNATAFPQGRTAVSNMRLDGFHTRSGRFGELKSSLSLLVFELLGIVAIPVSLNAVLRVLIIGSFNLYRRE